MSLGSKEIGSGYPVVLLHGFCADKSIWDGLLPSLSVSNRIVCVDMPGFGDSPILPKTSIEAVAEAVYNHLKSKGIFECIMIGHSLGGYVTLAIEEQYPQFLKAYGLFHSTALSDTDEKKAGRNKTIESVRGYGKEAFLKTFVPSLFNQDRLSEYTTAIRQTAELAEAASVETIIAYTEAMRDRKDRFHLIKESSKPILLIAGEKDNAVTIDKSLAHRPYIKDEYFHALQNVGHMGFYEEEQLVANIIIDYITSLTINANLK